MRFFVARNLAWKVSPAFFALALWAPAAAQEECVGGMAGIYPCDKIDLLAFMPSNQIGGGNSNDI